jgi:hypothetical protein
VSVQSQTKDFFVELWTRFASYIMRDSLFLSVGFIAVEIGVTAATFIGNYV